MTRSFPVAAALVCLALAGAAHAQQRVAISAKGFDLNTPAGAKAFYNHVSSAISEACGGAPAVSPAAELTDFEACYKAGMTLAMTEAQAQAPLLAALRAGKPAPAIAVASR